MMYRLFVITASLLCCLPALAAGDAPEESRQGGWVRLSPGARPAYVGIQGGTAPACVLRATDGSLFVFTGNTGSDFSQLLNADGPGDGAGRAPETAPASIQAAADGQLRPFGLSNPEGPALASAPAPQEEHDDVAAFKPLRLSSYKQLLAYSGAY